MEKQPRRPYRLPFILSVFLHLALIVALSIQVVGSGRAAKPKTSAVPKSAPVMATVVSSQSVDAAVARIEQRESLQKRQALSDLQRIQTQSARLKRQQVQAQKRLVALKAKQQEIAKQAKAQALAAEKLQMEKARQAAAQKKALAVKAEQAQLAALKQQAQAKALQTQRETLANQLLMQQMQAEQSQIQQNEINAKLAEAIVEYTGKISGAIGSYWNKPDVNDQNIKAVLMIDVGPGGVVLGVKLAESSGNAIWDRQAMAAAHKASPLPVPKDPRLFDKFRHLRLTVAPS